VHNDFRSRQRTNNLHAAKLRSSCALGHPTRQRPPAHAELLADRHQLCALLSPRDGVRHQPLEQLLRIRLAAASLTDHPSTAAIVTLSVTVGTWILSFIAAVLIYGVYDAFGKTSMYVMAPIILIGLFLMLPPV